MEPTQKKDYSPSSPPSRDLRDYHDDEEDALVHVDGWGNEWEPLDKAAHDYLVIRKLSGK